MQWFLGNFSGRVMISDVQRFPRIGDEGKRKKQERDRPRSDRSKERGDTKNKESLGMTNDNPGAFCASWDRIEDNDTLKLDRDKKKQSIRHVCA